MRIVISQEEEDLKKKLEKKFDGYEIQFSDADIGGGADLWVTILIIGGALFFKGKDINENLEAWKDIGDKIKSLFRKKDELRFLDKEASIALAISKISEKTDISQIKLISGQEVIEKHNDHKGFQLNFSPYNYFILIFEVNEIEKFIFCIKSNGEIKFQDYFENSEWNYNFDWNSYENRKRL